MFARFWPAPVTLPLAGRLWAWHQYRLRDLASLEAWAEAATGNPYALVGEAMGDDDALRSAYDQIEAAGGGFSCPSIQAALGSRLGVAEQLRLSARHEYREPFLGALADARAGEVDAVLAVAWGVAPLDFAMTACDQAAGVVLPQRKPFSRPGDWQRGLWSVIEATGYTPDQIGDMHLSQWEVVRSGGEWEPSAVVNPPDGPGLEEAMQKRRAWFRGQGEDPSTEGEEWSHQQPELAAGPE